MKKTSRDDRRPSGSPPSRRADRDASPAPSARSPPRPVGHRAHRPRSRSARSGVLRSLGRRRAVELPRLEHRPPLLHAEGRAAQIKAVIFRSALRYLKFKPADGLRVVARGRVSVYEPKGEYQLVCEHLEPQGLGALQLAFEQLKKRLQAEGLFDAARKRPLPALPRKIGIVTSLDGAALRDIIKVLQPALRERAPRHPAGARAGRRRRAGDRARRCGAIGRVPGRRRRHRRPRRRLDRRSVGVQRRVVARAIARCAGAGHLRRRPRNRRDHRRLRRRRPRADAVGGRRDGGLAPRTNSAAGSIGCTIGCAPRRAARVQRLEPPRAHARRPPGVCRLPGRGWRCAAGTPPNCRTRCARDRAARRCSRERRRAAASSVSSTTFDLGRRLARHSDAAGGGRRAAASARSRGGSIAPTRSWGLRRPARHAQPAGGARPRVCGLLERRQARAILRDARPSRPATRPRDAGTRRTRLHVKVHDSAERRDTPEQPRE